MNKQKEIVSDENSTRINTWIPNYPNFSYYNTTDKGVTQYCISSYGAWSEDIRKNQALVDKVNELTEETTNIMANTTQTEKSKYYSPFTITEARAKIDSLYFVESKLKMANYLLGLVISIRIPGDKSFDEIYYWLQNFISDIETKQFEDNLKREDYDRYVNVGPGSKV